MLFSELVSIVLTLTPSPIELAIGQSVNNRQITAESALFSLLAAVDIAAVVAANAIHRYLIERKIKKMITKSDVCLINIVHTYTYMYVHHTCCHRHEYLFSSEFLDTSFSAVYERL